MPQESPLPMTRYTIEHTRTIVRRATFTAPTLTDALDQAREVDENESDWEGWTVDDFDPGRFGAVEIGPDAGRQLSLSDLAAVEEPIDYACVYEALRFLGRMPRGRIANYDDFAQLPSDVQPLCRGNHGQAGIKRINAYLIEHA